MVRIDQLGYEAAGAEAFATQGARAGETVEPGTHCVCRDENHWLEFMRNVTPTPPSTAYLLMTPLLEELGKECAQRMCPIQ